MNSRSGHQGRLSYMSEPVGSLSRLVRKSVRCKLIQKIASQYSKNGSVLLIIILYLFQPELTVGFSFHEVCEKNPVITGAKPHVTRRDLHPSGRKHRPRICGSN